VNTLQTSLNNTATRRELKNLVAVISQQVTSLQDQVGNLDATGVLYPPRYTTTERNALTVTAGATIYNTTLSKMEMYNGSDWETLTSS
jgi:hypothetical protein